MNLSKKIFPFLRQISLTVKITRLYRDKECVKPLNRALILLFSPQLIKIQIKDVDKFKKKLKHFRKDGKEKFALVSGLLNC